jgi:hypothetical protein
VSLSDSAAPEPDAGVGYLDYPSKVTALVFAAYLGIALIATILSMTTGTDGFSGPDILAVSAAIAVGGYVVFRLFG